MKRFDPGRGDGGLPTEQRLREWVAATEALADDWVDLLARGFAEVSSIQRGWVRQELAGFARRLCQWQCERRGSLSRSARQVLDQLPASRDGGVVSPHPEAGAAPEGESAVAVRGTDAIEVSAPGPGSFSVTPEMFQRFARVTGMEAPWLAGAPEQVAGLMLYVVVFSILTLNDGAEDLEMQRLLKRLRLCREQFESHVEALFSGGPLQRRGIRAETRLGGDPTTRWLLPGRSEGSGARPGLVGGGGGRDGQLPIWDR